MEDPKAKVIRENAIKWMNECGAEIRIESRAAAIKQMRERDGLADELSKIKKMVRPGEKFLEIVKALLFKKKERKTEKETKKLSCSRGVFVKIIIINNFLQ